MKNRSTIFSLAALCILFLNACASNPTRSKHPELNLLLSTNRYLSLEPCGCSLGPTGGLQREAEFIAREKASSDRETVVLSGGVSFQIQEGMAAIPHKQQILKAETLVSALNLMEVRALGLASADFLLGTEVLLNLSHQAKFPLIATNLTKTDSKNPFWKTSHRIEGNGYSMQVFAVSAPPKKPVSGLVWEDPVAKIKAELRNLSQERNRLIIVLSSLDDAGAERLARELPEVNVIAGSVDPTFPGTIQLSQSTLFLNDSQEGQKVMKLRFQFQESVRGLYNTEAAKVYGSYAESKAQEISTLKRSLASARPSKRAQLKARLAQLTQLVNRAALVPKDNSAHFAEYWDEVTALSASYEPDAKSTQAVRDLIEAYKGKLRELALVEDGEAETSPSH